MRYYNHQASVNFQHGILKLYADITQTDKLQDLFFDFEGDFSKDKLSQDVEKLIGKEVFHYQTRDDVDDELSLAIDHLVGIYTGERQAKLAVLGALNSSELVCRCRGLDINYIKKIINEKAGDKKAIVSECLVGQVCGQCWEDFEDAYQGLAWMKYIYHGKSNLEWICLIQKSLDTAYFVNKSYSRVDYNVFSFSQGKCKIRLSQKIEGQDRKEIQAVLQQKILEIAPESGISTSVVF